MTATNSTKDTPVATAAKIQPQYTRASFVRSLPLDLAVEEVVSRGLKYGLQIKAQDVHTARYWMRKQADQQLVQLPKRSAQKNDPTPPPWKVVRMAENNVTQLLSNDAPPTTGKSFGEYNLSATEQLRLLVRRVGTVKARQVIDQIESELVSPTFQR